MIRCRLRCQHITPRKCIEGRSGARALEMSRSARNGWRSLMNTRVFIDGKSALDIIRRDRVSERPSLLRPSRVKSLAGCAYRDREVVEILAGTGQDVRSVIPEELGLRDCPVHVWQWQTGRSARERLASWCACTRGPFLLARISSLPRTSLSSQPRHATRVSL